MHDLDHASLPSGDGWSGDVEFPSEGVLGEPHCEASCAKFGGGYHRVVLSFLGRPAGGACDLLRRAGKTGPGGCGALPGHCLFLKEVAVDLLGLIGGNH